MHTILSIFISLSLLSPAFLPMASQFSVLAENKTPAESDNPSPDASMPDASNPDAASDASAPVSLSAPSALLMEASTGTIIYEKDAHSILHPASITKIMTLILIFDALDAQKISLDDVVTVSEHAASMGGSQVFLEPGETQTVDTMIKCISVASANDACVAMAEFIAGSEDAFVAQMNERAAGLGMKDTNFVNCCGLDVDNHMTSAYDVALMSRELITKYPQIHNYSTIWMENITHVTKKGSSEFGLTNTNKLIKQYAYATGLKTGSTGLAKYCVSATAEKDNIKLIAVIMAAPDYKVRFADASALLDYGFSICRLYQDTTPPALPELSVRGGTDKKVSLSYEGTFSYLDTAGNDLNLIEKKLSLPEEIKAPVTQGKEAGTLYYTLNEKEIGSIRVLYDTTIPKATYQDYFRKTLTYFFSL